MQGIRPVYEFDERRGRFGRITAYEILRTLDIDGDLQVLYLKKVGTLPLFWGKIVPDTDEQIHITASILVTYCPKQARRVAAEYRKTVRKIMWNRAAPYIGATLQSMVDLGLHGLTYW